MKSKETKSQEQLINLMLQSGAEWPEGCNYAAQDGMSELFESGRICGYEKKPARAVDDKSWLPVKFDVAVTIMRNIDPLPNWHQTIITREQYEARDGWITWRGGECPTLSCAEFMRRDLKIYDGIMASRWWHEGRNNDIVAYRIHKEQPEAKDENYALPAEPCESVKACIPEQPTIERLIAEWKQQQEVAGSYTRHRKQAEDLERAEIEKSDILHKRVQEKLAELGWPTVAKSEPEQMVINDWRDLRVGDIVLVEHVESSDRVKLAVEGKRCVIVSDGHQYPICITNEEYPDGESFWLGGPRICEWKFICRPSAVT